MKSFFILIFFLIIIFIIYHYSYEKFYTNKIKKEIKYLLLPITIEDQFKYKSLEDLYRDIFETKTIDINYDNSKELKDGPKGYSMQRFFTEF